MDEGDRLVEALQKLLAQHDRTRLVDLLAESHPADLGHHLRDLSVEDQVRVVRLLPRDRAGEVLSEVDDRTLIQLLQALDEVEVSQILDDMPADHAVEVMEELPADQAEKILDLMEEEKSEEVQELLEYDEETAGRLMSPNVVALNESATVAQALEHIRKSAADVRGFELFVVDDHNHLVGVVPLRRLLTALPETPVWDLLERNVVSVGVDTDQEEVARVVARYDLVSVPVVDRSHHLVGAIPVEDVIDILKEEASEDIFRMAGTDASELERRPPVQIALMRLPWVLATLVIELAAGVIIHHYDQTLSRVILLASFMPVIQAISGNTGLQSVTMIVRGLATGDVQLARWWEPLLRQVQTTTIIGAVCGLIVGAIGAVWHGTLAFGAVVGFSMFTSVNLSGLAGTGFPMLSKRLGFDPALTAGPFETAFQDLIGVSIFLALATLLLHWLAL